MLLQFIRGNASVFDLLVFVVCVIATITIHEFAHAFRADQAGDPTPRNEGRVTLNPVAHYDPIGTTMILLMGMGWGRPVMTRPQFYRHPRRDSLMISFWGPLSNILLAIFTLLLIRFIPYLQDESVPWSHVAWRLAEFNLFLAFFNLIPLYPLDGSKVLSNLLPIKYATKFDLFTMQYGMLILLLLVFGASSMIDYWVGIPSALVIRTVMLGVG